MIKIMFKTSAAKKRETNINLMFIFYNYNIYNMFLFKANVFKVIYSKNSLFL